jgi:hypothetical protein
VNDQSLRFAFVDAYVGNKTITALRRERDLAIAFEKEAFVRVDAKRAERIEPPGFQVCHRRSEFFENNLTRFPSEFKILAFTRPLLDYTFAPDQQEPAHLEH